MIKALENIPSAYIAEDLGDTKPTIVIGGKTDKFVPNVNLSFKCGAEIEQYFINFNRPDVVVDDQAEAAVDGTVALTVGEQTDLFHIDSEGRLKWDIIFDEKPSTNVFRWKIKGSPGVAFHYQGELSQEDIDGGCTRPDWAVGSYAVYGNKSGNGFLTGKLMHIPRPFCVDANGIERWADIVIDEPWLTITMPQEYLDSCTYPMRLDPTFGYTTAGASGLTCSANYVTLSGPMTLSEAGTVSSVTARTMAEGAMNVRFALYSLSGSTYTRQGEICPEFSQAYADGWAWKTAGYNSGPTLQAGSYYFAQNHSASPYNIAFDSTGSQVTKYRAQTYSSDPLPPSISSPTDWQTGKTFSVYATYTASGGGTTYTQALAGAFPAASGTLSMESVFAQLLAGSCPPPTGIITKQVNKVLAGSTPAPTGAVIKRTNKALAGSAPSPTGGLSTSTALKQAITGVMGTISGGVTHVLNPIVVAAKYLKIIGSRMKKIIGG